jgi:hypothetical protein
MKNFKKSYQSVYLTTHLFYYPDQQIYKIYITIILYIVLTIYKLLLKIKYCQYCAFVGLDNKVCTMQGTYINIHI